MRRGYIDSPRVGPNIVAIGGWVLALLIALAFAWYVFLGPGSSQAPAEPSPSPSPESAATSPPTAPPTALPTAPPTEPPTPIPTRAPLNTPLPAPTLPTSPTATLVAGEDGANVRSGPGTNFELLGTLDAGESAVITGRYEKWFQIEFEDEPAWVANWVVTAEGEENVPEVEPPEGVEPTPTETPADQTPSPTATEGAEAEPSPTATGPVTPTLVAGDGGANVRTGPATSFEKLGTIGPGESAVITGKYEDWWQIDYNGAPAWVASWVVTATGTEDVPDVEPPVATATPEPTASPTDEAPTATPG